MKRLIKFFILILFIFMGIYCPDRTAVAAQIANVEYVHAVIKQKWNINIPYNPELKNPRLAANMKYLLTTIDVG